MRSVAGEALDRAVAASLSRAIQEASKHPRGKSDAGATLEEVAAELGMSRSWVSVHLKRLFKAGKVRVGHRLGEDLTGRARWIPVYRMTKEGVDESV